MGLGVKACQEGVQLDGVGQDSDAGDEQGAETIEGNEDQEGVAHAGLDRAQGEAYLQREVTGLVDGDTGETLHVGQGKGMAVIATGEGVEIPRRSAPATRAKLVVAVGAAAVAAAHGPGAAARNGAACLVRVSRHRIHSSSE
jgi:hypothetical protein